MRSSAALALLFVGCATSSAAPQPSPSVSSATAEPTPAAAPAPAAPPVAAAPAPTSPPPAAPEPFDPLPLTDAQLARARAVQKHVIAAATTYDVDPNLINGIIWSESKFDPRARNRSGARGLMQLMPKTAKAMGKKLGRPVRTSDPEFSIHAGTYLFSRLRDKFDGDDELALFGYARGSGSVRKWQDAGGPIPEGVQRFIARVRRAQATFASLGFPTPPAGPRTATRSPR